MIDHTHDPLATSWLTSANSANTDFPLQNLPLGVVAGQVSMAIGDQALDLPAALAAGLLASLPEPLQASLRMPTLNALLGQGRPALRALRHAVFALLRTGAPQAEQVASCLRPWATQRPTLPCDIGDYSDFFASVHHARNTFNLFRPGQTFLPNYHHLPIAYHGRSSSIFASPRDFHRPLGQTRPDPAAPPVFGPARKLDLEVELGFYVGAGNAHGHAVPLDQAEQHLAGVCVLNDWSARDVQAWESQPLGPFLAKNFISVVSPWVVTLDALAPFRSPVAEREATDAQPLPYLEGAANRSGGTFDIHVVTRLQTAAMRQTGTAPMVVSRANTARDLWWTPAQMLAHHTVGGCNLRPGDLLGSGTISGASPGSEGSLLELTWGGSRPVQLPGGEQRSFLLDGDEVTISAWCERAGQRRIGLGECKGRVLPALEG